MESKVKNEKGESSSILSDNNGGDKAVIVRVKRKPDQSPLEAFWLEINERPVKRPLIDFQKLSISTSSTPPEELKTKRVLVQHVETVSSSEATLHFLQSFVQPISDDSKLKASVKERRRTLLKDNKHDQLLSKAKQEQEEIAKSARFKQIWKRRTRKTEVVTDEALDEMCRVYDVLRVDKETSRRVEKREEISLEDQQLLNKFLPLLRDCIPDAAEEIESDMYSHACQQDSDEYVYDLYTVKEHTDETEASYPFPLVQVDDDDQYYDGPDDSDYETDDSNAEEHPNNDYPEEESSEEEEVKSSKSGSESEEEESEAESDDVYIKSEDSDRYGRSGDPFYEEDEMNDNHSNIYSDEEDNGEDWRWTYR